MTEIVIIFLLGFLAAVMSLLIWKGNADTKRIEAEINAAEYLKDLRHQAKKHSYEVLRLAAQVAKDKEADTIQLLALKESLKNHDSSIAALTESKRQNEVNSRNEVLKLANELSELKASTRVSEYKSEQYKQKVISNVGQIVEISRQKDHEIIKLKHDLLTMTNKMEGKETEPLRFYKGIPIQVMPEYDYRRPLASEEECLGEEDERNVFHSVRGYGGSTDNGIDGDGLGLNDYMPEGMDAVDGVFDD